MGLTALLALAVAAADEAPAAPTPVEDLAGAIAPIARAFASPRPYVVTRGFDDFQRLRDQLGTDALRRRILLRRLTDLGSAEDAVDRLARRSCVILVEPVDGAWTLRLAGACDLDGAWAASRSTPALEGPREAAVAPAPVWPDVAGSEASLRRANALRASGLVLTPAGMLAVAIAPLVREPVAGPGFFVEEPLGRSAFVIAGGVVGTVAGSALLVLSAYEHLEGRRRVDRTRGGGAWVALAALATAAPMVTYAIGEDRSGHAAIYAVPLMLAVPTFSSFVLRHGHRAALERVRGAAGPASPLDVLDARDPEAGRQGAGRGP